jgi:hypothetical protein
MQGAPSPWGGRAGWGVVWVQDDEGWPFVVQNDDTLVPGDRFSGMPGNPYLLGPDRSHDLRIT